MKMRVPTLKPHCSLNGQAFTALCLVMDIAEKDNEPLLVPVLLAGPQYFLDLVVD
jgi:hypothetical protein